MAKTDFGSQGSEEKRRPDQASLSEVRPRSGHTKSHPTHATSGTSREISHSSQSRAIACFDCLGQLLILERIMVSDFRSACDTWPMPASINLCWMPGLHEESVRVCLASLVGG